MRSKRSRLLLVALCFSAAVIVACGDDGDSADETTTQVPPTTVTDESSVPPTTAPPPIESTVASSTAAPTATVPTVVRVTPELAPAPDAEVLYEAGVGSAPDQLGLEDCTQCDPMRPLTPLLASDGRLVIADVENRRWVVVDGGRSTTVAMPADLVAWDALMGPGDIVYIAAFTLTPSGPTNQEVLAFDTADLSVVLARSSIQTTTLGMLGILQFDGNEVVHAAGPGDEERFPLVRPAPDTMATVELGSDGGSPSVAVTRPDGTTTTWVLEGATVEDVVPLADGAVAVSGGVEPAGRAVWVLRPDGTYAGEEVATTPDPNGGLSVSERGVVSLERDGDGWRVVRFPLPS